MQLSAQRGGGDVKFDSKGCRTGRVRLLAVVTLHPKKDGRQYRVSTDHDYAAVFKAMATLTKIAAEKLPNDLSPIPDEPTPAGGGSGAGRAFSVQEYGMMQFGDFLPLAKSWHWRLLQSISEKISLPIGLQ